jgi:D-glycerate 3-kinase
MPDSAPEPDAALTSAVFEEIERRIEASPRRPAVIGICGAQGSGKSTLARSLLRLCAKRGLAAAALSLDDLYLTRAERQRLAHDVHPLLATRGVPGTHDIALGLAVLAALGKGEPALLPRFSKAVDDRLPRSEWVPAPRGCKLLLLEGWCVGAVPQPAEALCEPVNDLERRDDRDGNWRRFANDALAGPYQQLFGRLDSLVLLAAPGFEAVFAWRLQQEEELRASAGPNAAGVMDAAQLARFVEHYERLTRHILVEMPGRADITVRLAEDRAVLAIERNC